MNPSEQKADWKEQLTALLLATSFDFHAGRKIEQLHIFIAAEKEKFYAAGFKAATLASHEKPNAKEEERRRVITILAAIRENASIQEIIDRISKED